MRIRAEENGLSALAVAGTHVVILGWSITEAAIETGLLGFAIQREDRTATETIWLRGMKTFPGTSPALAPGGSASSQTQPFQTFQWGDYTAQPGRDYVYSIVPMHGTPSALEPGVPLKLDIRTEENSSNDPHSVYFNRGAIASQEYARKFQNQPPNKVGTPAYEWLSRGLVESILAFINQASDNKFGLRVAMYEFQWPGILNALAQAIQRGADVKVVYDAIDNAQEDPKNKNEAAIEAAHLSEACTGFTQGKIMHNKFIVLLQKGDDEQLEPSQVLTGSTNWTENGLYGHLNCVHVVRDPKIAGSLWNELHSDTTLTDMRSWCDEQTPAPGAPPPSGTTPVFSPQKGTRTLQYYAGVAGSSRTALFMTFAFGMNADFQPVYLKQDDILRFALMDKVGVGKGVAAAQSVIDRIRALPNATVAIGQNIELNEFDHWLKELDGLAPGEHVRWVHTKFMLVDPLSDDPIVITGSANFSAASVETNQENMLVIRGDQRVADIYLSEYMREFSSFAFRDAAAAAQPDAPQKFTPQFLDTTDQWQNRYRIPGSAGALRKAYFSGSQQ